MILPSYEFRSLDSALGSALDSNNDDPGSCFHSDLGFCLGLFLQKKKHFDIKEVNIDKMSVFRCITGKLIVGANL